MIRVRRHSRQTASGKVATVRQHERQGGGSSIPLVEQDASQQGIPAEDHPAGTRFFRDADGDLHAVPPGGAPYLVEDDPALRDAEPEPDEPDDDGEEWRDDAAPADWADVAPHVIDRRAHTDAEFTRMQAQMRDWRSRDIHVPRGQVDTSPLGRVLGTDTQEGADSLARLRAYREAGYDGPIDQDNNIPDPDDPENHEWLHAGAALRGLS